MTSNKSLAMYTGSSLVQKLYVIVLVTCVASKSTVEGTHPLHKHCLLSNKIKAQTTKTSTELYYNTDYRITTHSTYQCENTTRELSEY